MGSEEFDMGRSDIYFLERRIAEGNYYLNLLSL
jgi:hypothetical protein